MMAPRSFLHELPVSDLLELPQQKEGFARLKYVVSQKSLGVLTATPGSGKSSVIRMLESSLDKSRFLFCYINDSELKPKSLYSKLLQALCVQSPVYLDRMKKIFRDAITSFHDRLLVIVIDNAQDLPVTTIREFRYLMSFEMDSKSMLALILAGHPEFWDTLKLRTFEPVFQCVATHYRLPGLNETQTKEYIIHQLKLSELTMLFPDEIVKKIYQYTSGIPRLVNKLCRHCLIDLESNQLELVDNQVLERALFEFRN
jgi:type II secretory pathway predicted ATPase ExeA